MALIAQSTPVEESNLGLKVEGDLGNFQIIEDNSESDDETDRPNDSVALPSNLVQSSGAPIFGSVAVKNSDNVHFGNNTYFMGPVTIKQLVQSESGVVNPSYTRNDDDDDDLDPTKRKEETIVNDGTQSKKGVKVFKILLWHKLTFTAMFLIVIAGICAILSIIISNNSRNDSSSNNFDEGSASPNDLLIAPDHLRIVSRTDWLAQPVEGELDKIIHPIPWVIIQHTATESCTTQSECVLRVRLIQMFHIESRKWFDIGYNFLVAGDGSAYYGRGWDYVGAHTLGYNKYSVGISFIGTFNNEPPPKKQLEACEKLIKRGVKLGKLAKDYKLFTHRQLSSTLSPGDKLAEIIQTWPHFVKNLTDISELLPDY